MDCSSLIPLALAAVLLWFSHKYLSSWRRRRGLPFPPGPSPRPLVGNLLDIPKKFAWLTYTKWRLQYGDLIHVKSLGQHIVIVNSVKSAVELFEKRSHIHSDRPVITMVELLGWDFNVALMPLGDRWREHRRMFQEHFRRDRVRNYHPIQMKKVHQLLRGLLSSPQDFGEHLKTMTAAIIMATVYGYEVQPTNDRFVDLADNAMKMLTNSFFPGSMAVNAFPILRYLPSWMPGAGFQRFAAECRQLTKEMREVPFEYVKQNMRDGVDSNSMVARVLEANQTRGRHDEATIQEVAGTAYGAAAETTNSALASFFLAMAVYPDVQKKAQAEIDTVVGSHRLPEFADRPSLPFVEALYREVMRWKPMVPLGMAHTSTADDTYGGYFIPKGNRHLPRIPNHTQRFLGRDRHGQCMSTRAMTRDESIYPEPERFNPDRFFTADGKLNDDEMVFTFGFGRRICPGRHKADATVWATIVSVLSTFNIAKAKDASGKEIDIDPEYSDGLVRCVRVVAEKVTAAIIMATVYAYDVQTRNDHFVTLVENASRKLSESFFPGAVAVNMFPILRYLPSWMPGAGFQRFAAESRKLSKEMKEVPFNFVKQNMRDGLDSTSIVARLLVENQTRGRHDEGAIQEVAAVAYGAGAETTVSALATFFLAMATHPEVQKKAQTEIDTVVGTHRLPEFKDRPSLPFVEAVLREIIRWKPVGPLGVPHASTVDDIYNGYFIPKGTTVIGNIWAMTHDESIYPEPERFNPDRFFTADGKLNDDDVVFAFGFGRRICVGRHIADATVWATFVSILSTFNIAKAKDDTGKEIDIDPSNYSDGMVSHPLPFPCSITPRSETATSLVQSTTEPRNG
ncbi:putative cytochrome P450 [Mycena sanguinolenta]|uniref:Putative cytochrome P450 n=1 Tax=Mycena sanguinolenta TaxID=230812 RepID=A0A8H6XU95_9AGAR|nr:putative cytochrome P450 [Mycena sanguinolenta]